MATGQTYEWLVIVPDKPDVLPKRLEVRTKHLDAVMPRSKTGQVVMGGSFLSDIPKEGETPDMIGSSLVVVASTKEEVLELLKGDIYTTSGVWDLDKVRIWPFRTAIRNGL